MRKTKNLFKILLSVMLVAICLLPGDTGKAMFDGEILRFHVLANSNEPYDQSLKLKVRDRVLKVWESSAKEAKNAEEAEKLAIRRITLLREAALDVIDSEGYDYGVTVSCGVYPFPQKSYGSVSLPAGNYNAIRIVIGEGKGDNWWCVMYPPLCYVNEAATFDEKYLEGFSEGTREKITENPKIQVKFKIYEVIKSLTERK